MERNDASPRKWLPWLMALNVALLVTGIFVEVNSLIWATLAVTALFVLAPRTPTTLRLPTTALTVAVVGLGFLSALDAGLLPVGRL